MNKTHGERITVLETGFDIVIQNIKSDIGEIKTNFKNMNGSLNSISIQMPELLSKVNNHHEVFHDHVQFIDKLKKNKCNVGREENNKHDKRWLDQKKYKMMIYALVATLSGLIMSNIATCAWVAKNVSTILDSMPK